MIEVPDHPEIVCIQLTGYPSYMQESNAPHCEICGVEMDEGEVYEDAHYDCLCEECLLDIHKKW